MSDIFFTARPQISSGTNKEIVEPADVERMILIGPSVPISFKAVEFDDPSIIPSPNYPFVLPSGHSLWCYATGPDLQPNLMVTAIV